MRTCSLSLSLSLSLSPFLTHQLTYLSLSLIFLFVSDPGKKTEKRALTRTQAWWDTDLRLLSFRTVRNKYFIKPPIYYSIVFCYRSLRCLRQYDSLRHQVFKWKKSKCRLVYHILESDTSRKPSAYSRVQSEWDTVYAFVCFHLLSLFHSLQGWGLSSGPCTCQAGGSTTELYLQFLTLLKILNHVNMLSIQK
jgi:hypothetical protein